MVVLVLCWFVGGGYCGFVLEFVWLGFDVDVGFV